VVVLRDGVAGQHRWPRPGAVGARGTTRQGSGRSSRGPAQLAGGGERWCGRPAGVHAPIDAMSAFDFIKDSARSVVTTAKVWPTIMKATADDETPTPGYVIEELARTQCRLARGRDRRPRGLRGPVSAGAVPLLAGMTWEDEDLCQEVLSSLLKRLDKDAPFVKVKALRCIRYIVQKGHESFHRDIQRRADPIRNATRTPAPAAPK